MSTKIEAQGDAALAAFWPEAASDLPRVVRQLGLVADAFATIQIDLNVIHRPDSSGSSETTLCDHNCTTHVDGIPTGGSYTCPAAMSLNRGARSIAPAPGGHLIDGLTATVAGLRSAQREFLDHDLEAYFDAQQVPYRLRSPMRDSLSTSRIVTNLFGGSPENHPEVLDIVDALHGVGSDVHLTTTGRKILRDKAFREDFLRRPTDLIGLGADDFDSPADVNKLFDQSFDELTRLWRQTPWQHGQRRKAIEAVQLCKLAEREPLPPILFNVVLHPGNLADSLELMDQLTHRAGPQVVLNPYPVQTAFMGERGELTSQQLADLSVFVDQALDAHLTSVTGGEPRWNLAPRIGYWILMRSLLDSSIDAALVADRVGGADVWRCYQERGAGRCVQVGIAGKGAKPKEDPGGYLGCFWNNSTVTDDRQFWELNITDISTWTLDGRRAAAAHAADPCRGCLFPRMSMDTVSLELGLTNEAKPGYRAARRHVLGY